MDGFILQEIVAMMMMFQSVGMWMKLRMQELPRSRCIYFMELINMCSTMLIIFSYASVQYVDYLFLYISNETHFVLYI